jgi:hypothetical protein
MYQMSDIEHHSLLLHRDGSYFTKVNEELRRQELDPEQAQEEQKDYQGYNKSKSKKSREGEEEHYHEEMKMDKKNNIMKK